MSRVETNWNLFFKDNIYIKIDYRIYPIIRVDYMRAGAWRFFINEGKYILAVLTDSVRCDNYDFIIKSPGIVNNFLKSNGILIRNI